MSVAANPKYGHRWWVAGTVNDSVVEFGFEHNVEAISDFDDIVFRTNLGLASRHGPLALRSRQRYVERARRAFRLLGGNVDAAGRIGGVSSGT